MRGRIARSLLSQGRRDVPPPFMVRGPHHERLVGPTLGRRDRPPHPRPLPAGRGDAREDSEVPAFAGTTRCGGTARASSGLSTNGHGPHSHGVGAGFKPAPTNGTRIATNAPPPPLSCAPPPFMVREPHHERLVVSPRTARWADVGPPRPTPSPSCPHPNPLPEREGVDVQGEGMRGRIARFPGLRRGRLCFRRDDEWGGQGRRVGGRMRRKTHAKSQGYCKNVTLISYRRWYDAPSGHASREGARAGSGQPVRWSGGAAAHTDGRLPGAKLETPARSAR